MVAAGLIFAALAALLHVYTEVASGEIDEFGG